MRYIFLIFTLALTHAFANQTLDIYTNNAFLTHTFTLQKEGEIDLKVPTYATLSDIRFVLNDACVLKDSKLSKNLELQSETSLHVKKLEMQKSKIASEIKALQAKEALLKSLSLKTEFDVKKMENISSYLTTNLIKNQNEIDTFEQKLQEIEKKLQEILPLKKEYKNLHVSYTCSANNSKMSIAYPQKELAFQPFYELYANDKLQTIDLLYKAKISQNGLDDLNNININIYSYAFNKEVNPNTFYPHYIHKKPDIAYKENTVAIASRALMKSAAMPLVADTIELQELGSKYVYKLTNLSLPLQEEIVANIDAQKIDAKFSAFIDGYGTNKAYVQAQFSAKKEYQNAPVKLFLNSMPIAKNQSISLKKEQPTTLYLGLDQFLHVEKKLIQTDAQKTFFGGSEIDTQKWHYTIKNVGKNSLHVSFAQRVPVSKDGDVTVKTLAEPLYTSQNAEGKTSWEFELGAKETKEIIFGYEIKRRE